MRQTISNDLEENWAERVEDLFTQLRDTTINFMIPMLILGAVIVFVASYQENNWFWGKIVGLSIIVLVFSLFWLKEKNFLASSLLLIIGMVVAIFITAFWGNIPHAAMVLVLPIAFSALALGVWPAFGITFISSLFILLLPEGRAGFDISWKVIALFIFWCIMGIAWLPVRHLLITMQTVWGTYQNNLSLLAQSREYHLQLAQSLNELKEANLQLTRMNQLAHSLRWEAEQERSIKEKFVANVSHELRTPLNMIVGFCEVIMQSPEIYGDNIPPSLMADLDVVLRNAQHLAGLIDDVLDLSQIDAGQMALSKEQVDFSSLINSAVVSVKPLFASKGLTLDTEIAPDIPPVYCDPTRIREVLLNLLSNAGRFVEQGGVKLNAYHKNDCVVVNVIDTGPGIDPSEQEKLFKPFNQLNATIQKRLGGTGLGLSISKSFVDMHEGKMWVESTKGVGTTFSFTLPFQPAPPLAGSPGRWLNPDVRIVERGERKLQTAPEVLPKLAIVENGNAIKHLLGRYLHGIELSKYPSLEAALTNAEEDMYQALIVNDLQVDEVVSQVNTIPSLPSHLPIIICDVPDKSTTSEAMGVFDYLVKPVSQEALLGAIDRLGKPVKTLLLVEDDPDAMQLFRRILSSTERGYSVFRASNGLQALDVLQSHSVDLILMDLIMPEMDGFQFLIVRRKSPELSCIPVILLSAQDPQGQSTACRNLAVIVTGGISGQKLLTCMHEIIRVLSPTWPPAGQGRSEKHLA